MQFSEETVAGAPGIAATIQSIDRIIDPHIPPPFPNKAFSMVITGGMGSGKSTFLQSIVTSTKPGCRVYAKCFDHVIYMTPKSAFSSEANHPFKDHPRVYYELNATILNEFMDQMDAVKEDIDKQNMEIAEKNRKHHKKNKLKEQPNNLIIIDDFSEDLRTRHLEHALMDLLYKHRHRNCSLIITSLTMKNLLPSYRKLIGYFVIFKPRSQAEVQDFVDEVFTLTKDQTKQMLSYVFDKKYNQLFINTMEGLYYKNFRRLNWRIPEKKSHASHIANQTPCQQLNTFVSARKKSEHEDAQPN